MRGDKTRRGAYSAFLRARLSPATGGTFTRLSNPFGGPFGHRGKVVTTRPSDYFAFYKIEARDSRGGGVENFRYN